MGKYAIFVLGTLFASNLFASQCAVEFDNALLTLLGQDGTLGNVVCERTPNYDRTIMVNFQCATNFAGSSLYAQVDREQGESLCAVTWLFCSGEGGSSFDPTPATGKSAAEDFAAIRNACAELL
jgi:hypothetical protein